MPLRPDPFLARVEPLRRARHDKPWIGHLVAALGVGGALAVRLVIPADVAPFTTFYPVIIAASFIGGWRSGLLSVALSAIAAKYFLIAPVHSFDMTAASMWSEGLFVVVAATVVGIIALLNEALDRLHAQSANLNVVLETEPAGIIAVDAQGRIELVNKTAENLFGYTRQELYGEPVEMLTPEAARTHHQTLRAAYLQNPSPRHMGGPGADLSGRRKDGSLFPIEVGLSPLQRGAVKGVLSTVIDVSERRSAERRQQILMDEVRHRGRNLLGVVQALAKQTIPAEARKRFTDALQALARTQDLFLAAETAPLLNIIDAELMPFHNRVRVQGCDITLMPRAAQDFGLIIHELTTNAIKHGALSGPEGRIEIVGTVSQGLFTFVWDEQGGPPAREPERKGLGHVILHDVAHDFCERVQASYGDRGFRYELVASVAKLSGNVIEFGGGRSSSQRQ